MSLHLVYTGTQIIVTSGNGLIIKIIDWSVGYSMPSELEKLIVEEFSK